MKHISPDRVVAIAEGEPVTPAEARHMGLCRLCSHEVERTVSLLTALRSVQEPPLSKELLEHNAMVVDARIASMMRFRRRSRLRWALLPLAAAAVLVVMPRSRDTGYRPEDRRVVGQEDLSSEEYDALVQGLAGSLDELKIVGHFIERHSAPMSRFAELTGDELESLLGLLDQHGRG
ncbi:hypothetical protein JXA88_08385 [Candidatus Fermentibacteria bacterium]|nr:hypothetical protein [Candidatus Fermentibacteria bacterium]